MFNEDLFVSAALLRGASASVGIFVARQTDRPRASNRELFVAETRNTQKAATQNKYVLALPGDTISDNLGASGVRIVWFCEQKRARASDTKC